MPSLLSHVIAGVLCAGSLSACTDAKPASEVGLPPGNDTSSRAPNLYRVRFETSRGAFVVEVHRSWAPRGADRFHQLVSSGFFDNTRFFRVVTSFMVQFGAHGDPAVNAAWEKLNIPDDSVAQSNTRGRLTFAMASAPNSRTTQVFINLIDNTQLDAMGFAPIGQVIEGMEVVDALYAGYGDSPPAGFGPDQNRIMAEGNAYLEREFPKLDFIRTARLVPIASDSSATKDSAR